jgi:hypothetical protein
MSHRGEAFAIEFCINLGFGGKCFALPQVNHRRTIGSRTLGSFSGAPAHTPPSV